MSNQTNPNAILADVFNAPFNPEAGPAVGANRARAATGLPNQKLSISGRCWMQNVKNVAGTLIGVTHPQVFATFVSTKRDFTDYCQELLSWSQDLDIETSFTVSPEVVVELHDQLQHSIAEVQAEVDQ